ncbi:glycosyltransferase family 4 protein [Niallia taxi]|uniref:Glycosyltransferase family 1 protein n=1 Tax=Niallia taxi TaxID=2499688 RepID=A0A437K525_9BACI|nr:glycosyltransferase family 4 protein [Niallia taxi]MCM3214307.1 glycosyltransferase family 4 protein [Niallia taxi]MDK8641086.1 glycosyltransferase family 4 protein [Niallia taxi]RVT57780.1 glycosyltransferase family 1 protein [Niallia taxi]
MKILLATYWPIPHVGGVWNYMEQQKRELENLGHVVDLLGFNEDTSVVYIYNKDKVIEKEKIMPLLEAKLNEEAYPEIHANALVKYTEFQRYVFELSAAYLGLAEYDVIHTQDVIATASIARVLPEGTVLVATLHGSVAHEIRHQLTGMHKSPTSFMARAYYDELERIGATAASYTIVANNWMKKILTEEFQVPEEQIKVLHYGFDTDTFLLESKKVNESLLIPEDKTIITYTGRLIEMKGVHHLIAALGKLKEDRDDWVCWIIGEGDKQKELEKQAIELGLEDDVFFFGNRSDVPYLLSQSDIYVFPSLLENQPLSLVEAQIAGKPAIVSDAGGLPEMVEDGVTGLIYPAGDVDALYGLLQLLLNTPNFQSIIGNNAKIWGLDYWSLSKGAKSILEVYELALAKGREERR